MNDTKEKNQVEGALIESGIMQSTVFADLNQSLGKIFSTLDTSKEENSKTLFNVLNSVGTEKLEDYLGKEIKLANFIIQKYDGTDEVTGEVTSNNKVVLIDDKGTCYATGSKGIFNSLIKLISAFGMPANWKAPKVIKAIEKPLDGGRKTYIIELI